MINQMVYLNLAISVYLIIGIVLALKEQKELKQMMESGETNLNDLSAEKNELDIMRAMLNDQSIQSHPKLNDYRIKFEQLEERVREAEEKRNRLRIRNLQLIEKLRNLDYTYGEKYWRKIFLITSFFWLPQEFQECYRRLKR